MPAGLLANMEGVRERLDLVVVRKGSKGREQLDDVGGYEVRHRTVAFSCSRDHRGLDALVFSSLGSKGQSPDLPGDRRIEPRISRISSRMFPSQASNVNRRSRVVTCVSQSCSCGVMKRVTEVHMTNDLMSRMK